MFQMKEVGRKVAEKRKEKNMTQMELADLMGVSFQAVSNWERGNSMPDIAKLPELADLLGISIDEMLSDEKPAKLVRHIIDGDEKAYIHKEAITPETVAEIAPILKPQQTESLLEDVLSSGAYAVELGDLVSVAPFVSEEFLHEQAMKVDAVESIKDLVSIAPFLSERTLDALVEKLADAQVGAKPLQGLAPFLSQQTLNKLAERAAKGLEMDDLVSLAPFLSESALDAIVKKITRTGEVPVRSLVTLAPFLSEESLDWLAAGVLNNAGPNELVPLAPFLSSATLKRCAEQLVARYGVKGIKGIAPFL